MDHGGGHHSMPMPDMPGHGGHGGTDMPCTMSMVFNADPVGVCLVFERLQIRSVSQVVPWMLFIVLVSIACEYCRLTLQTFDRQLRSQYRGGAFSQPSIPALPSTSHGSASLGGTSSQSPRVGLGLNTPGGRTVGMGALLGAGGGGGAARGRGGDGSEDAILLERGRLWGTVRLPWSVQTRRSLFYVAHVALSFYVMLLVMSYNLQIIGAILVGAFVGHFAFQRNFDLGGDDGDVASKGMQCH
ncbi:hypothetical protein JCM10212_000820 [Sporobolomyces blumeae]